MTDIDVRHAAPDDWAAVREIRLRALADSPRAFGSTLAREQGYDEPRWRSWLVTGTVFVASVGGRDVGIAGGLTSEHEVELFGVWADPAVRATGAASAVVGAVIDWARRRGAPRVTAWAVQDNGRALAFYAKHGFALTGRDDEHIHEPGLRELEMELLL